MNFVPQEWVNFHIKSLESLYPRSNWEVGKMTGLEEIFKAHFKFIGDCRIIGVKKGKLEVFFTFEAFENRLLFSEADINLIIAGSKSVKSIYKILKEKDKLLGKKTSEDLRAACWLHNEIKKISERT